jgi:hypothetical protein
MTAKKKAKKTTKKAPKKTVKASKKKNSLEDIQNFTTGKQEQDPIKKVKELEEILGIKAVNHFGTNDPKIFENNLKESNLSDLQNLAMKIGIFPDGSKPRLKEKLRQEFKRVTRGNRTIALEQPLSIADPAHPNHERAKKLMGEGF